MIQTPQTYLGFIQIADLVSERILRGEYKADERIPSVREMAEHAEVNPNTVVRAYERLTRAGLIYTQRGLGYFASPDAAELIRTERVKKFYAEMLPALRREMELLQIKYEDLEQHLSDSK
ncbi:MAG: GntR family transcriptional regulator [Porphyromonadaceae bacterium]|nr:GntR family transcriptional regulator [Porphyromonadaceae bacterium]